MSEGWRNQLVERTCRHCATTFTGKYNSSACPPCRKRVKGESSQRFKERNPDYWRRWSEGRTRGYHLKREYGLTENEWAQLAASQDEACAICGKTGGWRANAGRLVVDHCHTTGKVRGLLCPSCNRGLGQFEDNPAALLAAATYLGGVTTS